MTPKTLIPAFALALCMSTPATAQDVFSVKLGGKTLGTISYSGAAPKQTLQTTLSDTPLGVFNGTMRASSQASGGARTYKAVTGAEGKSRTVAITHKAGRALETTVDPAAQITPLSDPTKVPSGIIDPVQAIGRLVTAPDCPTKITIYDGRRAVALNPTGTTVKDGMQLCQMSYSVVAGPPHLSPLKVSQAKMQLVYTTNDTPRRLTRIDVSHGIFKLRLERRN